MADPTTITSVDLLGDVYLTQPSDSTCSISDNGDYTSTVTWVTPSGSVLTLQPVTGNEYNGCGGVEWGNQALGLPDGGFFYSSVPRAEWVSLSSTPTVASAGILVRDLPLSGFRGRNGDTA